MKEGMAWGSEWTALGELAFLCGLMTYISCRRQGNGRSPVGILILPTQMVILDFYVHMEVSYADKLVLICL